MDKTYKFKDDAKIYHNEYGRPCAISNRRKFDINRIKDCYWNNGYIITYEGFYISIETERIPEFEAIFPEFPYTREDYYYNNLETKIAETNNRIDKLVSHVEALIIGLGQRKASEESLDI